MDLCFPVELAGYVVQESRLLRRKDRRGEVETDALFFLPRVESAENEYRTIYAAFPELNPLGQKSDAECVHPEGFKLQGNIHEAVTVCVRLDNRENAAAAGDGLFYLE